MAKNFWDYSTFSDPKSALDLLGNSIRKALEYNALGGPEFIARVLTKPIRLSPVEASAFFPFSVTPDTNLIGAPSSGDAAVAARAAHANALNNRMSKIVFTGRIETIHGALLGAPPDMAFAETPVEALGLIEQHTQFVSLHDPEAEPEVGDLVKVRLFNGDFGYDLQHGEYIEIFEPGVYAQTSGTPGSTAGAAPIGAQGLNSLFKNGNGNISTLGNATNQTSLGKNQAKSYTPKAEGERTIDTIVIHFTGGHCGSGKAQGTIDRMAEGPTIKYEVNGKLVPCSTPNANVGEDLICMKRSVYNNIGGSALEKIAQTSIHYSVDQGGSIVQGVLEKDIAYHAPSVNSRSIGIEINGSDNLVEHPSCKPSMFTPTLMNTLVQLVSEIAARHSIPIDRTHIKGHDDYYSGNTARRRDPGTVKARNIAQVGHPSGWDWDVFIAALKNKSQGKRTGWKLAQASDGRVISAGSA